ncbi:hypothetical protein A1Q2_08386 [Trichosporon asahii var. asahii CBS 8904]|uniref:Nucleoporin NSP1-like C-terminal domain-containing protein n=1 Tax=Trichosporon asahii var. asahii (strain CBS 8904) TaxID=1220162 RepID=K1VE37_TRIAC|nr:hypothetical protein A1Q2_08386 [Trichosporon asahii var. asahii CBS 8904]
MADDDDWVKELKEHQERQAKIDAQFEADVAAIKRGELTFETLAAQAFAGWDSASDSTASPLKSAFGAGSVFDSAAKEKRGLDEPAETGRSNLTGFGAFSGAASPFAKKEGTGLGAFGSMPSAKPGLPAWGGFGSTGLDLKAAIKFIHGNATAPPSDKTADGNSFNKPAGGSLFGQASTSTPAASTGTGFGGFGQQAQQSTTQPAASSGGLFGGFGQQNNAATTNTASTGGLFGQKPAAPATGGLFGQQQQSTTQPATGGLFGQQNQQQPAATGGLFGQQSQAKPAGGLFGQQSTTTPATGGLFGQQTQQQPATGGLFGQQSQAAKPAGGLFGQQSTTTPATGGLFGQPQQQQQQQQGGLFASQQPQQNSLFNKPAGGLLGNSTSFQQPQQQSGISKTAKFSDLPEGAQKVIEQMDAFFKDQRHVGQTIDAEPIGRAIWQTSSDIKVAHDEAAAIAQGLDALKHSLERLAAKVQAQAADLQKLLETWEAAKPADARHPGVRPVAHRDFPQEYFARVAAEEAERVTRYKRNIQLLSRAVVSLASDVESMTPQVVVQTIQNNQSAILALAAQLEGLEMRMNTLRANFTEHTNSMRDPFQVAREEKGLPLLAA